MAKIPILEQILDEKNPTTVISLPKGFDAGGEETVVPAGVDLRIYYGKNLNITYSGNGNLYLYKSTINRLVTQPGTQIFLQDCFFTGTLELYGTEGRIEGTQTDADRTALLGSTISLSDNRVIVENHSNIEFVRVNFENMHYILGESPNNGDRFSDAQNSTGFSESRVRFQECRTLTEFQSCINGENVRLELTRCMFFSKYKCISLQGTNYLEVTSCHLKGYEDMCLALIGTTGRVSDCSWLGHYGKDDGFIPYSAAVDKGKGGQSKGLYGAGAVVRLSGGSSMVFRNTDLLGTERLHDYGIKCDLGSTAVFSSSFGRNQILGGDWPCIECNGDGSFVSVIGYSNMVTSNRPAIKATDGGKIVITGAKDIESALEESLYAEDRGQIEIHGANRLRGKTRAVKALSNSKILIEGAIKLIEGEGEEGIVCDSSQITVSEATAIIGQTLGIAATNNSKITLLNVSTTQGTTDRGIFLDENTKLIAQYSPVPGSSLAVPENSETALIQGELEGLYLSNGSSAVLQNYDQIVSISEKSLEIDDASLVIRSLRSLQGKTYGVVLSGENSYFEASDVEEVLGETEAGIYGESAGGIVLENISLVEGKTDGFNVENAKYLHIRDCGTFRGQDGWGVRYNGESVSIRDIELVESILGEDGLQIEKAEGKLSRIEEITGYDSGLVVQDGANIEAVELTKVEGKTSPHGLDVISSTFSGADCNFILDVLSANSALTLLRTVVNGALVAGESSVRLDKCFINGHIHLTDSSYDFLDTTGDGEQKNFGSSGTTRNYVQNATFEELPGQSVHVNLTLNGDLVIQQGTSSTQIDGGFLAANAEVVSGHLQLTSSQLNGDLTAISGSANIRRSTIGGKALIDSGTLQGERSLFAADVDIPASSAALDNCTIGAGILNASSLIMRRGTFGSITASSASEIQLGGTSGGAITATNSGVQLRGASVGGVSLTGGGIMAVGGSAASINVSNAAFDLISISTSITGVHKSGITCAPGYAVRGGNGKRYEVYDDEVVEWYAENYKLKIDKDYELNVGKTNGELRVRSGKDVKISAGSGSFPFREIRLEAYNITPVQNPIPGGPDDPNP